MAHPLAEPRTAEAARDDAQGRPARGAVEHLQQRGAMPGQAEQPTPEATIAPLRPPVISRAAARVTRSVCDARLAMRAAALCGTAELCATVSDPRTVDAHFADPAVVELTLALPAGTGTAIAAVQVALDLQAYPALAIAAWPERDAPASLVHATVTPLAPSMATSSADIALRNAVAGVVLEPLLAQLTRFGFKDPRVVAVRRRRLSETARSPERSAAGQLHRASLSETHAVTLSFVLDGRRFDLAVCADLRCYDLLDALLRPTPDAASPANPGAASAISTPLPQPELAIPGRLIIGSKPLPVETLNALEPGDVLLRGVFASLNTTLLVAPTDPSVPRTRPRAVAAWGTPGLTRLCAAVEIDGQSLVIVKEPNMSEELDPASADAGLAIDQPEDPIRIGELELPVQFEIDTVALPLAQLSALGPGYVVELPVPVADAQLRLVAHGQTIGYGELVTVGEHLGIRIIRMAHRHGPVQ
ncbi:type III secretion system cytoplasmic ring protein SctQ [Paraburkholderia phenazinium]|uniref:Type III secretion protein Q n=1 Tax=Paraburkholderia phenazinium TaxID=60549 RepID=A0A1G8B865_9BURK|nr:type III secretion system cytoplasmic ring protein SctQ [Paraburkholderia phenazinium]SDH29397.1 type III secretion protein Q [Paraburkholderia phenazinium]